MSKNSKTARLLMTGDLHLGRSSTRLPEGLDPAEFRAAAAWDRIVDLAITRDVDVLCLSGDVVDANNRYFESVGPLESGIKRLAQRGIRTVAVAGNHDHEVLGALANSLEHFTLLGRDGWQRLCLPDDTAPWLAIDGWSFTSSHHDRDPLDQYNPALLRPVPGVPVLGMVHGDLDIPDSRYAPLSRARLRSAGPDAWLLGHIHRPGCFDDAAWILYPGSPQAFDPGETGAHGPWLAEVVNGRLERPRQIPVSSVRYDDTLTIGLDGTSEDELEPFMRRRLREHTDRLSEESGEDLRLLSLRLELTGATPAAALVPDIARRLVDAEDLNPGGARVRIESVRVKTTPAIDLAGLAMRPTAAGTVARLLLDLEQPHPSAEVKDLIARARDDLRGERDRAAFLGLPPMNLDDCAVAEYLARQGNLLLTRLLAQDDA